MTAVSGAKEVSWPRMPISLNRRPFAYTSRSIGPRTVCKVRMTGVPASIASLALAFEFDVLRCILFWVEDREMTQATSSDDHGVRELNGRLDQVGLQECITDESGHLRVNEARVQGGRAKWCLLSCMCIPRFKLDLHGARGSTNMADGLSVDGLEGVTPRGVHLPAGRAGKHDAFTIIGGRMHHHDRRVAEGPRGRWCIDRPLHGGHEILRGIAGPSVRRTLRSNEHDPPGRSPSVKGPSERHGRPSDEGNPFRA